MGHTGTMMKMQKSRGASKTSSRVAAFVAFVAAAVLLEGRGAHAATSGICKTPANFKPDVTFDTGAWGFGTQTCQSTVSFWQSMFGEVFDASWSCEGKPSDVQAIVLGISSYGCCDGPETTSEQGMFQSACYSVTTFSSDDIAAIAAASSSGITLNGLLGLISATVVAFVLV
ncbi:unnamed protein product [Bathycoccus prasinos]